MALQKKRDIRTSNWYEDVSDYFDIDQLLLKASVADQRFLIDDEPDHLKKAREQLADRFMSDDDRVLYHSIRQSSDAYVSDYNKSSSWKNYIFVCINGEKASFKRMVFYESLSKAIIVPLMNEKRHLRVLDYGCGSSLFTRLLCQDYGDRIETISADVCRYAVKFSKGRNSLYSSKAKGLYIDDVMAFPSIKKVDFILAYAVFEHLPNSTVQIRGLIDTLEEGGILVENYAGYSLERPHKSDTVDSYASRDINLDLLNERLTLLFGKMPKKKNGVYDKCSSTRIWIKGQKQSVIAHKIRKELIKHYIFFGAKDIFVSRATKLISRISNRIE